LDEVEKIEDEGRLGGDVFIIIFSPKYVATKVGQSSDFPS
jgi:hypothetical protein